MTTVTTTITVVGEKRDYGTGSLYIGKDGYWYGRWRTPDGRRPHRKIGPSRELQRDGLSKRDAEAKLRALILEHSGFVRGATRTVEEVGGALVTRARRDNRKASYVESLESNLRAHINPLLGDVAVHQVTARDADKLVTVMLRKGLSAKTIRNNVGTLHAVMERAVKDGLVDRNPISMGELPRVQKTRRLQFLTLDELTRVLDAAPPDSDEAIAEHFPVSQRYGGANAVREWWPTVRLLIMLAAMTGMRLGELRGLRWRDISGRVSVRESFVRGVFDDPKSELGIRAIPVAKAVMTALEDHLRVTPWNQDGDLVLAHPHTGRPLDKRRLGLHYKAALQRADVPLVRIHDLRHTFATTMAASGNVSIRTLQEWLGHEDMRTTQIYTHYFPAEREAELIDDAFSRGPNRKLGAPAPIGEEAHR